MQQVSEADKMADRVKQDIALPARDLRPTVYEIAELALTRFRGPIRVE